MLVKSYFNSGFFVCCILVLLVCIYGSGRAEAQEPSKIMSYEIFLQSRVFTPDTGITEDIITYIDTFPSNKVHMLVQFYETPDSVKMVRMHNSGLKLLDYLPNYCWFASISTDIESDSLFSFNIRWIGIILPDDKISSNLEDPTDHPWAINPDSTVNVIVLFFEDVPEITAESILSQYGANISGPFVKGGWQFTTSEESIPLMGEEDAIQWIEEIPPPPLDKNDDLRRNINADPVQKAPYNLNGADIDIGQWESGHADNASAAGTGRQGHDDFYDATGGGPIRINVVEAGAGVTAHATHVAGTMMGTGFCSNKHGGAPGQWRGVAIAAEIFSYSSAGNPPIEHQDAIQNRGIDLSNNSWGPGNCAPFGPFGGFDNYTVNSRNYDHVVTGLYGRKIPIVFCAGNEQRCTPGGWHTINEGGGTAKNTITVGAINADNDAMTNFSSFGPTTDGRTKPDVVAPGDESGPIGIHSCNNNPPDSYIGGPENWYGTSIATPAVTGSAALLIEQWRRMVGGDPWPSLIKCLLICGARDLGRQGPDFEYGFGAIDIKHSVDLMRPPSHFLLGSVKTKETDLWRFNLPVNTEKLSVTLVWDDRAGPVNAAKELVNDLDLNLWDPALNSHYVWILDPTKPGNAATRNVFPFWDVLNNVEQAEVDNPAPGEWTARVHGFNVPGFPSQDYSLCWCITPKKADHADAPDPPYPSLLVSDGARHKNQLDRIFEWLGDINRFETLGYEPHNPQVDMEEDSWQIDEDSPYDPPGPDDGIEFLPPDSIEVLLSTSGLGASRYANHPDSMLHFHGWMDFNCDGDWDDPGEHLF